MDKISANRRSSNMRAIRSKNTAPELLIRQILRDLGFPGYRLHRKDLPGKPDIAFIGRKKAIFIHGCFWHGHDCREGIRRPKSRLDYWIPKISGNQMRDAKHLSSLSDAGWNTLTIWECELKSEELKQKLRDFILSS